MKNNSHYLPNQTLAALMEVGVIRTSQSSQILYMTGDRAEYLYLVLKGFVTTFRMNTVGRKLALGKYEAVSVIGLSCLSTNNVYTHFAELQTETQYVAIHQMHLWNFLENNPEFGKYLLQNSINKIDTLEKRLEDTVFLGLRARLASLLLQIAHNQNTLIITGFSHRELAEMLGTHRETLTQTLNDLKQIHVLRTSRLKIELLKIDYLKYLAKRTY